MKLIFAFAALAVLTACGVDGVPIRPGTQDELARPRNADPKTGDDWIGGTVSVHTGAVI